MLGTFETMEKMVSGMRQNNETMIFTLYLISYSMDNYSVEMFTHCASIHSLEILEPIRRRDIFISPDLRSYQ